MIGRGSAGLLRLGDPALDALAGKLASCDALGATQEVPPTERYGHARSPHFPRGGERPARELLATFIHAVMGAEADALCGAGYGERSSERTNQRNGYRQRQFDTRAGTLDLAIPKLRTGSYFPDWLLERRKRAERALTTVVATCYLLGVSTRRMDRLVETLGIAGLSKSQVSVMAKELDAAVELY